MGAATPSTFVWGPKGLSRGEVEKKWAPHHEEGAGTDKRLQDATGLGGEAGDGKTDALFKAHPPGVGTNPTEKGAAP